MVIRKAYISDIEKLVENRMEFVELVRGIENLEKFMEDTRLYFENTLETENMICYLAEDEEQNIISSAILCIYQTLPTPGNVNGKSGILLNVYTKPEFRKLGIAYSLLTELIADASMKGVRRINLDYLEGSLPLYKKLGFKHLNNEMRLTIKETKYSK